MRSEAPPLLPVLRSRTQGELLALLLDSPAREWTLTELATASSTPLTTVQSEITRLEAAGILLSRKVGRARLVRPNSDNPLVAPLTQMIGMTFGPPVILAREFALPGVTRVVIFGSWAARFTGEGGGPPQDIDVLIVGDGLHRPDVYAAAERAETLLHRPVNPVLLTTERWHHPDGDALVEEIQRRPHVVALSVPPASLSE